MVKSIRKIIYCSVALLFFISCESPKAKTEKEIGRLENETSTEYNIKKIDSLLLFYQQYMKEFPQDSMVEEYLYRSGILNMHLRKGAEALSDFTNLINKFPQNKHLPEVYYYKAFIYEDIIYDIALAKTAYYDFITRYPNHKLVQDATLSIQYLGKSAEEIVASFERQNTTTSKDKGTTSEGKEE
jgi:outer membrane protein assembly factor BamD (BamD/ComL family)